MKATLTYLVNGEPQQIEFDSASDAIDAGVQKLLSYEGYPVSVTYNGQTLATQGDFSILWDDWLRSEPRQ
jgi:hypothetical protein